MVKPHAHWGQWIEARSHVVGFKRQADFAAKIGCGRTQLSKWFLRELPPDKMRKGFDRKLAAALDTTRQMLFHDYAKVKPEEASGVLFDPDEIAAGPVLERLRAFPHQSVLNEILARMFPTEVERVVEFGLMMVLAKNDARRPEFEKYAEALGFPDSHFSGGGATKRIQAATAGEDPKVKLTRLR